jgi:hypothetical protein
MTPTKKKICKKFLYLLLFEGTFTSFSKDKKVKKKSQKTVGSMFFLLFLLHPKPNPDPDP